MKHHLACNHCGFMFDEPATTHTQECPKCSHFLLIPSYQDWKCLKDELEVDEAVTSLVNEYTRKMLGLKS